MNIFYGWFEFLGKKPGATKNAAIEKLPNENCKNEEKVKIESLVCKEEQLEMKIQCQTMDGKLFEVSSCLLMQCKFFSEMFTNLDLPIGEENGMKEKDAKPFILQLSTIKAKCFRQIVNWMRHRRGKPEFELKFGPETGQQCWFAPDEWERKFGFGAGMNLEQLKELYLAANFLNLESLFHYCVQELPFHVVQANNLEMVRQFLCLADDMSQKEKEAICLEFDINIPNEINLGKGNKVNISLPPELIHPIFAKLSLSDQRWLLTLNRDAYEFLGGRIKENWPKWKEALNEFAKEEMPTNWYYKKSTVDIPSLWGHYHMQQWNAMRFLEDKALQMEMQKAINLIEEMQRENVHKEDFRSKLVRAIDRMDALFKVEKVFQGKLAEIMRRYENKTSMNAFKRGLHHLIEERRQIVEEFKKTGLKKLKGKLADLEDLYWIRRL